MGLEIFQKFHEIFKYFKVKYFIVHLYIHIIILSNSKSHQSESIEHFATGRQYMTYGIYALAETGSSRCMQLTRVTMSVSQKRNLLRINSGT